MARLSKFERRLRLAAESAAAELGLVGVFEKSQPHHKLRVVLPDDSIIKLSLATTPRCDDTTLQNVTKKLRSAIMENLRQRGIQ